MTLTKVWHHYKNWEDFSAGLWRSVSGAERVKLLKLAINFTGDAKLYGSYMQKVIRIWPISCEQNLTDQNINRRAWIGHAACCLAIGSPDDVTRSAWGYLTPTQQDEANAEADRAISDWEQEHARKNRAVHREVEASGLSR